MSYRLEFSSLAKRRQLMHLIGMKTKVRDWELNLNLSLKAFSKIF